VRLTTRSNETKKVVSNSIVPVAHLGVSKDGSGGNDDDDNNDDNGASLTTSFQQLYRRRR
jgi:hypothetical protein